MSRLHKILSGLLVLQLALAAMLWLDRKDRGGVAPEPLLAVATAEITRVEIAGASQQVALDRDEGWRIEALDGLPADAAKVEAALDSLLGQSTDFPVTTSASAHQRFEVADDEFQRRVTLYRGDAVAAELLLGTSPGFRQVHLRRDGEDEVFVVGINAFDYPADPGSWLDSQLLAVAAPQRIVGADYALVLKEGEWQAEGGQALDSARVEQLVSGLENLRVTGVSEETLSEADSQVISVSGAAGERRLLFQQQDDRYLVRRDDIPQTFTLSQYDHERLAGVDFSSLQPESVADAGIDNAGEGAGEAHGDASPPE